MMTSEAHRVLMVKARAREIEASGGTPGREQQVRRSSEGDLFLRCPTQLGGDVTPIFSPHSPLDDILTALEKICDEFTTDGSPPIQQKTEDELEVVKNILAKLDFDKYKRSLQQDKVRSFSKGQSLNKMCTLPRRKELSSINDVPVKSEGRRKEILLNTESLKPQKKKHHSDPGSSSDASFMADAKAQSEPELGDPPLKLVISESPSGPSSPFRFVSSPQEQRRYSKRRLRGPYGEMLEEEMRKSGEKQKDFLPRTGMFLSSQSLDDATTEPCITPKRKVSANYPLEQTETRTLNTTSSHDPNLVSGPFCQFESNHILVP